MALILENAIILNSSKPYKFQRANLLILENKIAKISKFKISYSGAQKIDCKNKAILPSFINAHTHAPMSILRGFGQDLDLFQWLNNYIWPLEKKLTKEDVYWGTMLSIMQMFYNGISCFNEHYFHIDAILRAVKKSKIRAVLGYSMIDLGDFKGKGEAEIEQAKKDLELIKNENSSLILPSINPHAPHTCSFELLKQSSELARKQNCILHTHAAETKKEVNLIKRKYKKSPIQVLAKANCLDKNTILAHCIYCNSKDIDLIKNFDSNVAHCPVANFKLGSGSSFQLKKFLDKNINVAFGTDGPASNDSLSLLESAKFGAIIQKNLFSNPTICNANQILYMLTEGGAKALKLNSGKIQEGFLADLVFFDLKSPELVPFVNNAAWIIYAASSFSISDLIINGEFVMQNKKILTFQPNTVFKKAQRIRNKLNSYLEI
ncbi:MAG: amidohydrolase [Candidatus Omnitrophica bacterium]|nr:amidohydrolase [Candidatus Omnitrophota bacterium]